MLVRMNLPINSFLYWTIRLQTPWYRAAGINYKTFHILKLSAGGSLGAHGLYNELVVIIFHLASIGYGWNFIVSWVRNI